MTAHLKLMTHLEALADDGHHAPCVWQPLAGWTSEDPGEQRTTAALCGPCDALPVCREYALTHPKESGVYGGLTEAERRPRKPSTKGRTNANA